MPEDDSLGALVAQASNHVSTLLRSELELAKSELKFDAKRVGVATGMFAAAAFMLHLVLILASFTIAFALIEGLDWPHWLGFLVVTVFYVLTAAILSFIGYRRLKGLSGFKMTKRGLVAIKGAAKDDAAILAGPAVRPRSTDPTAGQIGEHRTTVSSG